MNSLYHLVVKLVQIVSHPYTGQDMNQSALTFSTTLNIHSYELQLSGLKSSFCEGIYELSLYADRFYSEEEKKSNTHYMHLHYMTILVPY